MVMTNLLSQQGLTILIEGVHSSIKEKHMHPDSE